MLADDAYVRCQVLYKVKPSRVLQSNQGTVTMSNIAHEQHLVDGFVSVLQQVRNPDLSIRSIHNKSCRSRTLADVDFTAMSGQRWAIEAKYGAPDNRPNEVHKLFGHLLRETGRSHSEDCKIGLLLHHETERDFRKGVRRICRDKFLRFGCLIPVQAVFVLDLPYVRRKTWMDFYDGCRGRRVR